MAVAGGKAETLVESLLRIAARNEDHPAFIRREGEPLTYGTFVRSVGAAAEALSAAGVGRGCRVVIAGPNSWMIPTAYFAIHAVGAVVVPLGPDVVSSGLAEILEDCRPQLVLVDGVEIPASWQPVPLAAVVGAEVSAEAVSLAPRCRPADDADILYTTGTTGRRKGVVLTHANIASAAAHINAFIGTEGTDVEVVPIPFSHSFGLGRVRCLAQKGHTIAIEPGMRNPAALLRRLVEVRASGLALVPAGFALLRRMVGNRIADVAGHLRYVEIGSAPMEEAERKWLLEHLPATRFCHHFGLTEASRAVFADLRADSDRPGAIGKPSPGVRVRIADERGRQVPVGQAGEIMVHGGMVMKEYWSRPDLTARTKEGDWLRTGDTGYVDQDGYVYLLGRQSEIINVGGLKVAPARVEEQLRKAPGIVDAACVGSPDPNGVTGQIVNAFVVVEGELDREGLVAWLRGRLAEHEIPKQTDIVETIPRTASGKIQRHLLPPPQAPES